jgi:uracil phosphoribosyltransferase
MSKSCSVIDHPLVQHKLTLMRDKRCPAIRFRQLIREIAVILAYEVTRDLPLAHSFRQKTLSSFNSSGRERLA